MHHAIAKLSLRRFSCYVLYLSMWRLILPSHLSIAFCEIILKRLKTNNSQWSGKSAPRVSMTTSSAWFASPVVQLRPDWSHRLELFKGTRAHLTCLTPKGTLKCTHIYTTRGGAWPLGCVFKNGERDVQQRGNASNRELWEEDSLNMASCRSNLTLQSKSWASFYLNLPLCMSSVHGCCRWVCEFLWINRR